MLCSGTVSRSYESTQFIHSFSNLSDDRSNASSKMVPPRSAQYNNKIKCVNTKLVLRLRMSGTLLPFEISWRVQDSAFYVTKTVTL